MTRAMLAVGLAVVAVCAAVLSFASLYDLAVLAGFGPTLAALVPVLTDAGALSATAVWLSGSVPEPARRFGRLLALMLLGLSVVGNAAGHVLTATGARPPALVVLAVGALAPMTLAAVVHLGVLVRQAGEPATAAGEAGDAAGDDPGDGVHNADAVDPDDEHDTPAPIDWWGDPGDEVAPAGDDPGDEAHDPGDDRVAELVAAGVGRRRLARELQISEHEARELLASRRNGRAS